MDYTIKCLGKSIHLSRYIDLDSTEQTFLMKTALRFSKSCVRGNVVTPIGRCSEDDLREAVVEWFSMAYLPGLVDINKATPWSVSTENYKFEMCAYGTADGVHFNVSDRYAEECLASTYLHVIKGSSYDYDTASGCLFMWAIMSTCDIDVVSLADALRRRGLKREDMVNALDVPLEYKSEYPRVDIGDTSICYPSLYAMSLKVRGVLSEASEYMP